MKKILYILIPLFVLFWGQSCYYDDPPELSINLPDIVSFSQHVQPIFAKSCSTANCHDGRAEPDLRVDKAYTELVKGGYLSTTFPKNGLLYRSIDSNDMPPGGTLTTTEKALILKWLEDGALNN